MTRLPKRDRLAEARELELLEEVDPLGPVARPVTRADCQGGARPCPFVTCRHHLYLCVAERTGSLKINRPDVPPDALEESCSLDIAERGGTTLEEVGAIMNLTRERVRQVLIVGLAKLERSEAVEELRQEYGLPKRRLPIAGR
jgi:hypothetical protein